MSIANWPYVYRLVCKAEGGYWDDPKGGPTMNGVTQKVYDSYRFNKGLATQSVRLLTVDERTEIFRGEYWQPIRGDELPTGLDYAVFDYAINSGPTQAIKDLQRVLNVAVDGLIGAKTINAAKIAVANGGFKLTIPAYVNRRWEFMQKLSNFAENKSGWRNRLDALEPLALEQAANGPFDSAVMAPDSAVAAFADDPAWGGTAPGSPKALYRDLRAFSTLEGRGLLIAAAGVCGDLIPSITWADGSIDLSETINIIIHGYSRAAIAIGLCAIAWEYFKRRDEKRG